MSILVNTKMQKALIQSNAITDYYPQQGCLFSDGFNSVIRFALGYVTTVYQPLILPVFLGYKYCNYKPNDDTIRDVKEYGAGMVVGLLGKKYGSNEQVPNYFKLKEMGLV